MNDPQGPAPLASAPPKSWSAMRDPVVAPSGFREYDARWLYPEQINLAGAQAVGAAFGTQIHEAGRPPVCILGHDYRAYQPAVARAFALGLIEAGIKVRDIGPAITPMAYFAQARAPEAAVTMITASHNPNGWTGVKMGFESPLTHGPEDMARLRDIALTGAAVRRPGGGYAPEPGVEDAYLDDLVADGPLARPLKVVCAAGNGGAGRFAEALLTRLGAEIVPLHTAPDFDFPVYNPNPESLIMLDDMAAAVLEAGADLAFGFDGDGDRCGVVDDEGEVIFADRMGLLLARDFAAAHPGARFVVDVKSTGLYVDDPALAEHGATTEYWKTGHSHMKRRVRETGALAGFERSGHYFLAPPLGRGYDCGLRVATEVLRMLDRRPGARLSELNRALPRTWAAPTMSPACPDAAKYDVVARLTVALAARKTIGGRRVTGLIDVNGARVQLEGGGWGLIRASSNTPNLVVTCESPNSADELRAIWRDLDELLSHEPSVGPYDQRLNI